MRKLFLFCFILSSCSENDPFREKENKKPERINATTALLKSNDAMLDSVFEAIQRKAKEGAVEASSEAESCDRSKAVLEPMGYLVEKIPEVEKKEWCGQECIQTYGSSCMSYRYSCKKINVGAYCKISWEKNWSKK